MESDETKNIYLLSCVEPLLDTWGAKKSAGSWDLILEFD